MLRHKKHASAFIAFLMAFALIFTSSGIGSLTFTKADDTQTIYYNGESVTLSEHALYVNRNLWRDFLNFPYFTGFPAP